LRVRWIKYISRRSLPSQKKQRSSTNLLLLYRIPKTPLIQPQSHPGTSAVLPIDVGDLHPCQLPQIGWLSLRLCAKSCMNTLFQPWLSFGCLNFSASPHTGSAWFILAACTGHGYQTYFTPRMSSLASTAVASPRHINRGAGGSASRRCACRIDNPSDWGCIAKSAVLRRLVFEYLMNIGPRSSASTAIVNGSAALQWDLEGFICCASDQLGPLAKHVYV
jgi:hypothetical protein